MNKAKTGGAALVLGAIGVVFGDIGTSPLYAVRALFGANGQNIAITQANVYGLISLIIWSLMLVVSFKYMFLIMRTDNKGEGGIMALVSIVKETMTHKRLKWPLIMLGIIGMALFYGDTAITPAISVLSAVEGLKVVTSELDKMVLPLTVTLLVMLFWLQQFGTNVIGRLFGPVMAIWFLVIGVAGGWQVAQHPDILASLSPLVALRFFVDNPLLSFLAMGAIILVVTGAEALYADMGHFGRKPIARAWFWLAAPALLLCYMGQGTLILRDPVYIENPLFYLFPTTLHIPVIILATLATLIASQAVISGAFSLTRQAIALGFLPKLTVKHTSSRVAGQVYLPLVNIALLVTVVLLVLYFGSSTRLSHAYGVAVAGALAVDTILFLAVLRSKWQRSRFVVGLAACLILPLDLLFVTSGLLKIPHGGWVPLVIALGVFVLVTTWIKGQSIVTRERREIEGPLMDTVEEIHHSKKLKRYPGQAVYFGHHPGYAPLALRAAIEESHELPHTILIISVIMTNQAHVPKDEHVEFDGLGAYDGISHLTLHYGYHDSINIPKLLKEIRGLSPELELDLREVVYYISHYRVVTSKRRVMKHWRKILYSFMARNALSTSDYYKLPLERTQEVSSLIKL